MERVTFKALFYIKKNKIAKNGEAPIMLRITVNGSPSVTSLNLKVDPKLWDNVKGKSKGKDRNSAELNHTLETIKLRVFEIYRDLIAEGVNFSSQIILDKYHGKDKQPQRMLLEVFQEHNDRCHEREGKDMAAGTIERYDTSLRLTREFIQLNFKCNDIPLEEVNHKFITDYEHFFKTVRNCNHNTTTKYLKNFKKIIRIALANEYIKKDPFINIKFRLEEVDKDFLTLEELKTVYNKEFVTERLEKIRDFFVFCCFTGLAFSDLKTLAKKHLIEDNSGRLWIRKKRQKTKNMCNIPLHDIPLQIIEKYKDYPTYQNTGLLLPVISNTKMNAYLKEISDVCGINKQVSTHTARHTFATTIGLANGASIENVSKMLGHTNTKMTQHYARVLDSSIMNDMMKVSEKISML